MSILGKRAARPHDTTALIAGIAAFTTWGLIPGYWKLLNGVSPPEILAHRFVWTSLFLIGLLSWQKRWPEVNATTSSRRATVFCLTAGLAVATHVARAALDRQLRDCLGSRAERRGEIDIRAAQFQGPDRIQRTGW